jgi:hypothetical protein
VQEFLERGRQAVLLIVDDEGNGHGASLSSDLLEQRHKPN